MLQRQGGEMGSFGSIAGAETALTRDFGRHVFEIAALLRVPQRLHNYRVWVVGATGIEPVTPTMSRFAAAAHLLDFRSLSLQLVNSRHAGFPRFFHYSWKVRGKAFAGTGRRP